MTTLTHTLPALLLAQNTSSGVAIGWAAVVVAVVIGVPLLIIAAIYMMVPLFRLLGTVFGRIGRFIASTLGDIIRGFGSWITALVLAVFSVFNVILGRWSAAHHYGRAGSAEFVAIGACAYRLLIGNPARLFFLEGLVEGLERRVPAVMANAPGATGRPSPAASVPPEYVAAARSPAPPAPVAPHDHATMPVSVPAGRRAHARAGQFPGYEIVGTLPGGGSGSRLYIARPDEIRRAAFARDGQGAVGDVVIKSFSIAEGSTLPSIIRENRALDAARKLGLVLDHSLSPDRFYYVMRYVPGDSLSLVAQRLHAHSAAGGLGSYELERAISYVVDLVATLDQYHRAGLWHKDIKPDNIIVTPEPPKGDGRAHLVDFGLLTPLRGTMTLTTHGTEYFRDPEMVRMALRGVKVHEVDGAKFDVYGAGAVLYSVMENSFPANGGLSVITRACPETIKWIVRRAMTEYAKRYPSAAAMLADLHAVQNACRAGTIGALRVADLPSMREGGQTHGPDTAAAPPGPVVANFAGAPVGGGGAAAHVAAALGAAGARLSAREQLERARARVAARRDRARGSRRFAGSERASGATMFDRGPGAGVLAAVGLVVAALLVGWFTLSGSRVTVVTNGPTFRSPDPTARVVLAGTGWQTSEGAPVVTPVSTSGARTNGRAASKPVESAQGAPVLVMGRSMSLAEGLRAQADVVLTKLRGAGFEVLGEDGSHADWRTHLTADLLAAVGLKVPGTADANAAVDTWLAQPHEGEGPRPVMVVWCYADEQSPSGLSLAVFLAPDAPEHVRRAAAVVQPRS